MDLMKKEIDDLKNVLENRYDRGIPERSHRNFCNDYYINVLTYFNGTIYVFNVVNSKTKCHYYTRWTLMVTQL